MNKRMTAFRANLHLLAVVWFTNGMAMSMSVFIEKGNYVALAAWLAFLLATALACTRINLGFDRAAANSQDGKF